MNREQFLKNLLEENKKQIKRYEEFIRNDFNLFEEEGEIDFNKKIDDINKFNAQIEKSLLEKSDNN